MKNYLKTADSDWFKSRVAGAMLFIIMAFVVLFIRLFYLQIIQGKTYRRLSDSNSIRIQLIDPPRGLIFDRKGELVVDNRPCFNLSMIPRDAEPIEQTVETLSGYSRIPQNTILKKIENTRGLLSYQPILLEQDIGRNMLAVIEAHKYDLPGIIVDAKPVRHYIGDHIAAHLIGYLSEIGTHELASKIYGDYRAGDFIGKFGIEKAYESLLRGKRGGRQVEVNAVGQVVRVLDTVEASPGHNVYLTIDKQLQEKAEELMSGKVGSAIAMDPRNGYILALVSSPSFDQNAFVGGMSHTQWSSLVNNPQRPMENKCVQGEYPPASVFKIVTAIAALEEKIIDRETVFYCPGYYEYGDRRFRCWKKGGHGSVNVISALSESCDVFFYQLGQKLGIDKLAKYAKRCGFGSRTGIILDNEAKGLIPDTDWKKQRTGQAWHGGDTLSVAIGQSYNLTTPIQILVLTAALGNGGRIHTPMILDKITSANGELILKSHPKVVRELDVSGDTLEIVRTGLWKAVNSPSGTAWRVLPHDMEIAGKTGTAQVVSRKTGEETSPDTEPDHLKDHAWFTAFAPLENPRIAVTVLVEHGGSGSSAAAPLAGELIRAYLSAPEVKSPGGA